MLCSAGPFVLIVRIPAKTKQMIEGFRKKCLHLELYRRLHVDGSETRHRILHLLFDGYTTREVRELLGVDMNEVVTVNKVLRGYMDSQDQAELRTREAQMIRRAIAYEGYSLTLFEGGRVLWRQPGPRVNYDEELRLEVEKEMDLVRRGSRLPPPCDLPARLRAISLEEEWNHPLISPP